MSGASDVFSWGIRSDVGRVREVNQDAAAAYPTLFVVADGMGGHKGGEVASAVAIEAMTTEADGPHTLEGLVGKVQDANASVIDTASGNPDLTGMGTTVCAVALLDKDAEGGPRLGLVNVGDSRIYRYVDGALEQISQDHSLVGSLVREGHLSPEEAAVHPHRNVVTRALGIADDVEIDYWETTGRPGEQYLLCSDGLVDELSDNQIAATFRRLGEPQEVVDDLVRQANEAGARDNVTVLVVRVDVGEPGPANAVGDPEVASSGTTTVVANETSAAAAGASVYATDDPPADDALAPELPAPDSQETDAPLRTRRSLRKWVIALAVAAVLAAVLSLVGAYARSGYFVGFNEGQVVVYEGRPGGVLWFDPTIEQNTPLIETDLSDALKLEIGGNPTFDSVSEAEDYVAEVTERAEEARSPGA